VVVIRPITALELLFSLIKNIISHSSITHSTHVIAETYTGHMLNCRYFINATATVHGIEA